MSAPEQPSAEGTQERRAVLEAIVASTVGTTIEWYDFFLYGTAAALVFPRLFFPEFEPVTGLLLSFGTFTAGFLARPLGGVLFGHLGDRIGRKSTLVATLLLMGVSTFLIGALPTHEQAGVLAPTLLTALRVLQGRHEPDLVSERDAIYLRLGIVNPPVTPLPASPAIAI